MIICFFSPLNAASNFLGSSILRSPSEKKKAVKISGKVCVAMAVATSPGEEIKEYGFQFPLLFVSLYF